MTGTGTQADPYIPTTLTEFITAVGTTGAYVALTQDINAADDPAYTGQIQTPVWRARDFEGGNFEVSGVIVSGQQMIYHQADGTEARNFRLRDWAFKPINQTPAIFCGYRGAGNIWKNVIASVKADLGGYPPLAFCDSMVCYDSGFDITYTGGSMTGLIFDFRVQLHRCTVRFDGIPLPDGACCASGCVFDRSAIIYQNAGTLPSSCGLMASGSTWESSYIAVLDPQPYPLKSGGGSTVTRSIIAGVDGQSISGSAIGATLAQMQDKDWLTSVGFLP